MDMVVTARRFPQRGETVFGNTFGMFPGGKGANQAVCCAKLGGKVHFVGKMGDDVFRERLVRSMKHDGVRLGHLLVDRSDSTGIALITVDRTGQNEIVVVSGSNMKLRPSDVELKRSLFSTVRVVLLQLEIPLETVAKAAEIARSHGATVILNPAPARTLTTSLLKLIDYLTPNETEAEILSGVPVRNVKSAEKAARKLLKRGVKNIIVTMGSKGCLLVNRATLKVFPAKKVKPVDSTAAGDAFNGALALSLANGGNLDEAINFANTVAAVSVTRMGAQTSMPTMRELRSFV